MHTHQTHERLNQWLSRLGDRHSGLSLDEHGRCFIVADSSVGMLLSCPLESRLLTLTAELISVAIPLSPPMYEQLLALNLQPDVTGGAQIFFSNQTRTLGLLASREVELLDEAQFVSLLTRFKSKVLEMHQIVSALVWTGTPTPQIDAHRVDIQFSHLSA
jgi:hypothetical protein